MILFVVFITAIIFGTLGLMLGMTMQQNVNEPFTQAHIQTKVPTISKTPLVKEAWSTYTSPNGDYAFMYPAYWQNSVVPANKWDFEGVEVQCSGSCKNNEIVNYFSVSKSKSTLSLDAYAKQQLQELAYDKAISESTTLINGHNAIALVEPGDSQAETGISYYVINKGIGYNIEIQIAPPIEKKTSLDELPPLIPNILSTFKFTN